MAQVRAISRNRRSIMQHCTMQCTTRIARVTRSKNGTKIDESMQAGETGHERVWKDVKTNLNTRRGEGPCQECERMDN